MGTRFKDTDPERAADETTQKDIERALQQRVDSLEENINAFIASVDEITFNVNEEDAEPWMSNWQAELLSGKVG